MNVLYVYADSPKEMNCSQHNCIWPAESLNRNGKHHAKIMHVSQFATNSAEVRQFCLQSDILVIERNFYGDTIPAIMFWRVRNKPMIAVFDDAYHIITKDNPSYPFWHDNKMVSSPDTVATRINQLFSVIEKNDKMWGGLPFEERKELMTEIEDILGKKIPDTKQEKMLAVSAMEQFTFGLKMMKGIQVPSRTLAEDWSNVNDTYYLHNYINPKQYLYTQPILPKKEGEIIVGWHGSMSHVTSFKDSGVSMALEIIAQKYDNVKIYLGGDKRNYDSVNAPEDKKMFGTFVPAQQWPSLLSSIDIAVAPLSGEYDKRRSWIRGIEYMILKMPWVGTKYPTYEELDKYTTLIDNSVENWVNALSDMIENLDDYRERAKGEPFEFAQSQSYDENMEKNIKVYEKAIDKAYKW